ncbi:MAG: tetratricopeptide repeat protein [Clostridia bacterium]|nr:tetratricopeptide repeat protein [Clostridia bacterium]
MREGKIPSERILKELDEMLRKNDYRSAREHLDFWLSEAKERCDERGVLLLLNELMGLCRKLGERENALYFVNAAFEQIEKMQISQNIGAATTYLNSATVYKAFGLAEDAIPLFSKAKEIYEANLMPDDDRLGGLYNNMALALADLGRFAEAEEFNLKALAVMARIEGKEPEQAITYLNMASAAEAELGLMGAESRISELIEKAKELLDRVKERDDGGYAFACEKCAPVFGYYGYFLYENEISERARRIYEGS